MKDSPEKISPLRRRMIEDMQMRKLATHTQSGYIRTVRHFAGYLGRSPDTATDEDLRRYQLHCVDRGVSPTTLNATITTGPRSDNTASRLDPRSDPQRTAVQRDHGRINLPP